MKKSLIFAVLISMCLLLISVTASAQAAATPKPSPSPDQYNFGDMGFSQKDINKAVAAKSILRAKELIDKKEYDAAIKELDEAIWVDPGSAEAYQQRGIAYAQKADNARSFADLTKAVELAPKDAYNYYLRGVLYHSIKNEELAIKDLNDALRLNSAENLYYYTRGTMFLAVARYDEAFADCSAALKIDQRDGDAYYCRGTAYSATGRTTLAREDFLSALRIDPKNETYLSAFASTDKRLGGTGVPPSTPPSGPPALTEADPRYVAGVKDIDDLLAQFDKVFDALKKGLAAKDSYSEPNRTANCGYHYKIGDILLKIQTRREKMKAAGLPTYEKGLTEYMKRLDARKNLTGMGMCNAIVLV